ncbi:hypothetical protein ACTJLD_30340 [Burkholderia sp. 22088]|uniref:hypothetical protein n=1 Tax=Burkholderia sp. 22088 TaxID=3453871 RepID=UPI003F87D9CE
MTVAFIRALRYRLNAAERSALEALLEGFEDLLEVSKMAAGNAKKRESLKTALNKYERSPKDRKEDMKGAKKLQAKDNAMSKGKGKRAC